MLLFYFCIFYVIVSKNSDINFLRYYLLILLFKFKFLKHILLDITINRQEIS